MLNKFPRLHEIKYHRGHNLNKYSWEGVTDIPSIAHNDLDEDIGAYTSFNKVYMLCSILKLLPYKRLSYNELEDILLEVITRYGIVRDGRLGIYSSYLGYLIELAMESKNMVLLKCIYNLIQKHYIDIYERRIGGSQVIDNSYDFMINQIAKRSTPEFLEVFLNTYKGNIGTESISDSMHDVEENKILSILLDKYNSQVNERRYDERLIFNAMTCAALPLKQILESFRKRNAESTVREAIREMYNKKVLMSLYSEKYITAKEAHVLAEDNLDQASATLFSWEGWKVNV